MKTLSQRCKYVVDLSYGKMGSLKRSFPPLDGCSSFTSLDIPSVCDLFAVDFKLCSLSLVTTDEFVVLVFQAVTLNLSHLKSTLALRLGSCINALLTFVLVPLFNGLPSYSKHE
jgi:hypothetical protein